MHCPPRWGNAYIDGTLVDVERMPCGSPADVVQTSCGQSSGCRAGADAT